VNYAWNVLVYRLRYLMYYCCVQPTATLCNGTSDCAKLLREVLWYFCSVDDGEIDAGSTWTACGNLGYRLQFAYEYFMS
jgi:hypothetical protein